MTYPHMIDNGYGAIKTAEDVVNKLKADLMRLQNEARTSAGCAVQPSRDITSQDRADFIDAATRCVHQVEYLDDVIRLIEQRMPA